MKFQLVQLHTAHCKLRHAAMLWYFGGYVRKVLRIGLMNHSPSHGKMQVNWSQAIKFLGHGVEIHTTGSEQTPWISLIFSSCSHLSWMFFVVDKEIEARYQILLASNSI